MNYVQKRMTETLIYGLIAGVAAGIGICKAKEVRR
jgi:hypothetical protein